MKRITSIDFARGLVMIIMALDHVRDLMHLHSADQSPTDLATTTPILFFTRWITYLCAPTFVLLAGISAYMSTKKRSDLPRSRSFLTRRGVWLIVLEFTAVNFGMFFDAGFHTLLFEVIATIGWGFIILSLLVGRLNARTIALVGLGIICFHDLFFLVQTGSSGGIVKGLTPLFSLAAFPFSSNRVLVVAYPPLPWLGILMTGYGTGTLFERNQPDRMRLFLKIGSGALLIFIIIRLINFYGDPAPWSLQKNLVYSFLSFINVSKYPPSFLFCAVTLSLTYFMLAAGEAVQGRLSNFIQVYGKVPLFYFIVHFYLIHAILILVLFAQGFFWSDLHFASGTFGRPKAANGLNLFEVYLFWAAIVALLYIPCRWFGRFKATHPYRWLKYL